MLTTRLQNDVRYLTSSSKIGLKVGVSEISIEESRTNKEMIKILEEELQLMADGKWMNSDVSHFSDDASCISINRKKSQ